jgi:hypothetical protein
MKNPKLQRKGLLQNATKIDFKVFLVASVEDIEYYNQHYYTWDKEKALLYMGRREEKRSDLQSRTVTETCIF